MKINTIRSFFFLLFLIKIIIGLFYFDFNSLNGDEEESYFVAAEHFFHHFYLPTAIHSNGSMMIYEISMFLGISKKVYILLFFCISNIIYFCSLFWFFRLASCFLEKNFSFYATLLYGLYPSVLYFVGSTFCYENIGTYFLIYVVFRIIQNLEDNVFPLYDIFVIPFMVVFSCLLRSHLIIIYFCVFAFAMLFEFVSNYKKKKSFFSRQFLISIFTFLFFCCAITPILEKNKKIFGHKTLSTQTGYELSQGHNPFARGSWNGGCATPGNVYYEYVKKEIPNLSSLNEYEQSNARKNIAINWMINHPKEEIVLTLRKIAIYFLPQNYEVLKGATFYNPITLLVHLFFFGFLFLLCFLRIELNKKIVCILIPIAASLLLSILFFVGYRWRFYAEPFMILCAFILIEKLLNNNSINHKIAK